MIDQQQPAPETVRRWRRHALSILLSVTVTAGTLIAIASRRNITLESVIMEWRGIDLSSLALIFLLSSAFHVFAGAHKLWSVLKAMRVDMTYGETVKLRLGAGPVRFAMPMGLGELIKISFFSRHKHMRPAHAAGAVVFDRGLNVIGAAFWLTVGIALIGIESFEREILAIPVGNRGLAYTGAAVAAGIAYVLFFFAPRLHDFIVRTAGRVHRKAGLAMEGILYPFRTLAPSQKLFFAAYGVFFQARPLVVCYLLFTLFGWTPDPGTFIAFTSIAMFAGHLPSVAGAGPREMMIVYLFRGHSLSDAALLGAGSLLTFSVHVAPMLIGLFWVPWFVRRIIGGTESP